MNYKVKELIMKRILQCMMLLCMGGSLALPHVTIDWFKDWMTIDFPISGMIFILIGVLFLSVTIYE